MTPVGNLGHGMSLPVYVNKVFCIYNSNFSKHIPEDTEYDLNASKIQGDIQHKQCICIVEGLPFSMIPT